MSFLSRASLLWQQPRFRKWLAIAAVVAFVAAIATTSLLLWQAWDRKGTITARGGLPFIRRVELPVPSYLQNDPKWGDDLLGPTDDTVGGKGCALSSAAMVLSFYGIDTDPQRLNRFLTEKEGFTPQGWLYWEKAAELAPDRVRHVYEDLPSYRLIDTNLLHGNPVIVRLKNPHGGLKHFVVIAGKDGLDYLTQDPGTRAGRGIYRLKEKGWEIEALRFYQKL